MRSLKRAAALLLSVLMVATTAFSVAAADTTVPSVSDDHVLSATTVNTETDVKVEPLVFNNKLQGPMNVTITMGDKVLRNGRDFMLVYQEHKLAGKYHLFIVGIGKYSGVLKDAYWTIEKKPVNVKVTGVASSYKASTLKKAAKQIKLNVKGTVRKVTYKVTKGAAKYISVNAKGVVTLKKGAPAGTYKVTISAPANKNFKAISKVVTLRVR